MERTFFAKVDSINETSYDTFTLCVFTEENERVTIRIDKNEKIVLNSIYEFFTTEIEFKEKQQQLVTKYAMIDDVDITIERRSELMAVFYNYAPVDVADTKLVVETYLSKIENKIIKDIVFDLYEANKTNFYLYPAATKFHHAYIGGLSYHTATMMKLIDGFLNVYPFLNYDLLVAGVLLHDINKIVELSNYAGPEYTKEGKLLGHITMGVKAIELSAHKLGHLGTEEVLLIEHMVLSHHYYGNYGSPKKPNIPEALILHFIDNIDSKLTVLKETLDTVNKGEFTQSIPVLDRERYYKSKL